MYCRYKCDNCFDWHPLSDIPTSQLVGCWIAFTIDPPEPFDARLWDILIKIEMAQRSGHKPNIQWT